MQFKMQFKREANEKWHVCNNFSSFLYDYFSHDKVNFEILYIYF